MDRRVKWGNLGNAGLEAALETLRRKDGEFEAGLYMMDRRIKQGNHGNAGLGAALSTLRWRLG